MKKISNKALKILITAISIFNFQYLYSQQDATLSIPTYDAIYSFNFRGQKVGRAEISLTYDASEEVYVLSQLSQAEGLAKLFYPNIISEKSTFIFINGELYPQIFSYEDSKNSDDDFSIQYNLPNRTAVLSNSLGVKEFKLENNTFDRVSVRAKLMMDMIEGIEINSYELLARDGLAINTFEKLDQRNINTDLGNFESTLYVQNTGSLSRALNIWVSPNDSYLPIKIEQVVDGEIQTSLLLESLDWLN
ncbi:MAG: hypothetical protein CBC38_06440 [Gammaproteobacteria bacterium TMED78]|nr:MAG: hypothetical protein CBC38_06440 [Gammaproteobacteria bacterium TMED78]|tara:strand:+ start:57318 stop:58061 length:744 start_codon:yes stop_codon:yes gene_type:complete